MIIFMGSFERKSNSDEMLFQGVLSGLKLVFTTDLWIKETLPEDRNKSYKEWNMKIKDGFELIKNKLYIRCIKEEDIDRIKNSGILYWYGQLPSKNDIIIELFLEKFDDSSEYRDPMDKTLLALRFLKEGYVSIHKIFLISYDNKSAGIDGDYEPLMVADSIYYLTPKDIPNLKDLLNHLMKIDWVKHFSYGIACYRFGKSYDEKLSNKLIDLYIGLEALFCKKDVRNKGEKIGISCSDLLGESDSNKEIIKNTIIEGYRIRNSVVHGNSEDVVKILEICPILEDYLRKSLILLIPKM